MEKHEGASVTLEPEFGPIGEIIYLRTYSRWNENENRRENWIETVNRTADWSLTLDSKTPSDEKEKEASKLKELWGALKAFPAGRSLWVGGTEYATTKGFGQFNCSYTDITEPQDFYELAYLLMSGSGVGFRVTKDNIQKLRDNHPLTHNKPDLFIEDYEYVGQPSQLENTRVDRELDTLYITVGDSREGWSEATGAFLMALTGKYGGINRVIVNVNYIRPKGAKLSTFGGYASGPQPMVDFFIDAHRILFADKRGWTSVKALDVANMIGRMVVSGGSRRSAQIGLGDFDDKEYREAKTGDWYKHFPWRSQSNNTVIFDRKPSKEELKEIFGSIMEYGEPGFLNEKAAQARRPNFRGVNPCGEILLDSKSVCNLTTVNLMAFTDGEQIFWDDLKEAIHLQARHNLRVTNVQLELEEWDYKQKRDRLLGMSFTGYGDLIDYLDLTEEQQVELLQFMAKQARETADAYAEYLGVPKPLLATTLKPEGSITQLPGVSSGVHPNFGPHYIRRVRISEVDAVAKTLKELGYSWERDQFNSDTLVFEFPIETVAKRYAYEYSAIEMLNRYKLVMQNYVEHNASITVYITEDEVDSVIDWLDENWDTYVAVSFLKKSDETYPQMPYERISREEYYKLKERTPEFNKKALEVLEGTSMQATDDLGEACSTGSCPLR